MKSFILKEPMVLFLFLAMVIFTYDWLTANPYEGEEVLVISEGNIRHLTAGFEKTWQRPPTREELKRLVDERIREEVYYREALALRLDNEDTIVRRRLRQKYEFLVEDLGNYTEPSDDELYSYMNEHPELFRIEARFAFQQIYLDASKPGNTAEYMQSLKQRLLDQAIDESGLPGLGDSFMLPFNHPVASSRAVDSNFGSGFAARLMALPTGRWEGPIESGYGLHLVRLEHYSPARMPALEEVRQRVLVEWQRKQKQTFLQDHYESLLMKYEVVVEDDFLAQGEDA